MAVTAEQSTQRANQQTEPVTYINPDQHGSVRSLNFDFTQGGSAGDAGSTVDLWKFHPGKVRIKDLDFACSAFGASRVLKFGYRAHKDVNGDTVAEDDDAFASGLDVSSAADIRDLVDVLVESQEGFTIFATCTGGTIPSGATLNGFIDYVREAG